jgi:hypothetical protein
MNSESKLLLELWDYLRDVIPAAKREESALHVLQAFEDHGFEIRPGDIQGEDTHLDSALEALGLADEDELEEDEY